MPRTRKAWRVVVEGHPAHIIYARTAAKARAKTASDVRNAYCDLSWIEAVREIRSLRRHPAGDVILPDRHPLAAHLPRSVLNCVTHAFGGTGLKAGYRDHYYAGATDSVMRAALYHGLFEIVRVDPGRNGRADMRMYALTPLGRNVASGEVRTYPERWE